MSSTKNHLALARYKCQLNSTDISADFEVRSKQIVVRAQNAIDAQERAQAVTGRGVVEVCRLEEVA